MFHAETLRPDQLPPSFGHGAIDAAAAEYRALHGTHAAELRELEVLHEKHGQAREQDEQAAADAIRAGKRTPAPDAQRKALEAIEAKERRLEALQRAIADSRAELIAAVTANADELARTFETAKDDNTAAYVAAIDAVANAHRALTSAAAMLAWLHGFTEDPERARWSPGAYLTHAPGLLGRNGEPLAVAAVLAALHEVPSPPKPRGLPRMPTPSGVPAGAVPGGMAA